MNVVDKIIVLIKNRDTYLTQLGLSENDESRYSNIGK